MTAAHLSGCVNELNVLNKEVIELELMDKAQVDYLEEPKHDNHGGKRERRKYNT
jgi:hypothetical protein